MAFFTRGCCVFGFRLGIVILSVSNEPYLGIRSSVIFLGGYSGRRLNVNSPDGSAPKRIIAVAITPWKLVGREQRQPHSEASHVIAGMFVAIFKSELGYSGFIELAQTCSDHAVVLLLRRAR